MILQGWSKGDKLIDTESSIVHTKIWMMNENNLKNSKTQTCKLSRDLSHTAFFFAFQLKTKCAAIPSFTFSHFLCLPFVPPFSKYAVPTAEYDHHGVTEQRNSHEKPIKPWNSPVAKRIWRNLARTVKKWWGFGTVCRVINISKIKQKRLYKWQE